MPRDAARSRPFALRLLKASFHAAEDGLAGIQQLAHDTNLLFYAQRGGQGGPGAPSSRSAGPSSSAFPKRP